MARLISGQLPDDAPSSERKVVDALRKLPDSFRVFHGVNWLDLSPKAKQRVGETDLVIVHPAHGILVIEVKGGRIHVENGKWYSTDRHGKAHQLARSPALQARDNLFLLRNKLLEKRIIKPHHFEQGLMGYAVWFPDVAKRSHALPLDLHPSLVLDGYSLNEPEEALAQAFSALKRNPSACFDKMQVTRICQLISPDITFIPGLDLLLQRQEQKLVALTNEQRNAFGMIRENRRLLVSGGAGTGKTVLACEDARRLAEQGKSTLVLCFNRLLAEHLNRTLAGNPNITAASYHGFVEMLCKEAGIPFSPPNAPEEKREFFNNQAPLLLLDAADRLNTRYDALIVDEGQDFLPDWWDSLESVLTDDAVFHCFHDANQKLFRPEWKAPFDEPRFGPLNVNCRNTAPIGRTARRLGGIHEPENYRAIEGVEPKLIHYGNHEDQRKKLAYLLEEWIEKERLAPQRIVILSPFTRSKSAIKEDRIGKWRVYDLDRNGEPPAGITFSTIHAFKGLEADAVILVDLDGSPWAMEPQALYVAASRAKHLLAILASRDATIPEHSQEGSHR